MKLASLRWIVPAIISITLSGPALAAASLPAQGSARAPATATTPSPTPAPAATAPASSDVATYAQREQAAQELEKFRGGAGIYIGGSAVVLVLLIILLVILL
jgi:hypothetical protein